MSIAATSQFHVAGTCQLRLMVDSGLIMSAEIASLSPEPSLLLQLSPSLTVKQRLFVFHYLETRNATKAARLAGYSGDYNVVASTGWENLQKPQIKAEIERFYETKVLSANNVLAELSDVGNAPWRDFVEVRTDDEGNTIKAQVKLTDKIKALELLGKYHKLLTDRVEQSADLSDADVTRLLQQMCSAIAAKAEERRLAELATGSTQDVVVDVEVSAISSGTHDRE